MSKILLDPHSLIPQLDVLRARGCRIVFANGCFELLHVGHIRYLTAARALGDVLIVAVNTDRSLAEIKPGRRVVTPDLERMEIISALSVVDFVVPLDDRTPVRLIDLYRPDVQAKGTDYTLDQIPERVVVERHGGRVELVGGPKVRSTRWFIRALREEGSEITH